MNINKVVPISKAFDIKVNSDPVIDQMSELEENLDILQRELPLLCNDVMAIVGKPFRLIWDPTMKTAATDCQAEIRLAPWFFLNGHREEGYGTAYHESGHIKSSPYGSELLQRADKEGGEILVHLLNIILDRKDDLLLVDHVPGFADRVRNRLAYICTMTKREDLQKRYPDLNEDQIKAIVNNYKPDNVYEDFFLAAKWHKAPRYKETHRAMKHLRRNILLKASSEELLWRAKKIRQILGEPTFTDNEERRRQEKLFMILVGLASKFEQGQPGYKLDSQTLNQLQKIIKSYLGTVRVQSLHKLENMVKNAPMIHPGPLSTGMAEKVPIKQVKPKSENQRIYDQLVSQIENQVEPLVRQLRKLDNPAEFTLYGQDQGDLDLDEVANIATGLPGIYKETVTERDIDAEIHFVIDNSGSMIGQKVHQAKLITVLFSEAVDSLGDLVSGRIWSYNSKVINDYGPPTPKSGFVHLGSDGCNSDTFMLEHVGNQLLKSQRKRKILIALCDDGPDNLKQAAKMTQNLWARGIICIHIMIGVHGTPDIYPVELLYDSMDECIEEFCDLISLIIKNMK